MTGNDELSIRCAIALFGWLCGHWGNEQNGSRLERVSDSVAPNSRDKGWAAAGFVLGVVAGMILTMILILIDRFRFGPG
jgi:hypothetical protein